MPRKTPEERSLIKSYKARANFFSNLVNNLEAKGLSESNTALLFEDVVGESWRDLFIQGVNPSDSVLTILKRKSEWYTIILKVLEHPDDEIRLCTFMRSLEANLALIRAENNSSLVYEIINGMFDEDAATTQFIEELSPLVPRVRYEFLKKIVLCQFKPETKLIDGIMQSCVGSQWEIDRALTNKLKKFYVDKLKKIALDYPEYSSTPIEVPTQVLSYTSQATNSTTPITPVKSPENVNTLNVLEAGTKYCEKMILELRQLDEVKKTLNQLVRKFEQLRSIQEYLIAPISALLVQANQIKTDCDSLFIRLDRIHQQLPFANFSALTKIKQTILRRFTQFDSEVEKLAFESSKPKLSKKIEHLQKSLLEVNETISELWKIVKQQASNLNKIKNDEIIRRKQEEAETEHNAFIVAQEKKLAEWKAYIQDQQEEALATTGADSASLATSSSADEPEAPEIHPEIGDDLLKMPKAYFELTQRILNLEKGIKYNSVCLLIERHLHGKIQDNGTSHRKICLLRGEITEFVTGCKRDTPTGVGGLWNPHRSGSHPTELIPFSVELVRNALVNAGITVERVAEITVQRKMRKETSEETEDSILTQKYQK